MATLPGLSSAHELQVQHLLRFAAAKRVQHVKECTRCVDDLAAQRIEHPGDVLSGADVSAMLSELRAALKAQVEEEVANAYHSCVLMLQLALQQAQAAGASVFVDTRCLEDGAALGAIRAAEAVAAARPAADFARRAGALDAIGARGGAGGAEGPGVEQLQAEVEALKARLQQLQISTTAAMRDKTDLARRLEAAEEDARAARREADSHTAAAAQGAAASGAAAAAEAAAAQRVLERLLAEAQEETRRALDVADAARMQLATLQVKLQATRDEASALEMVAAEKVQASKQFTQLRELMADKVVELRRRIAKYEPEDVASADG